MIPNMLSLVQAIYDLGGWDFTTKDGLCAYAHTVRVALHRENSNFGALRKVPAQNHCTDPVGNVVGVDVTLWLPTGETIDFIVSAGFATPPPTNTPCWNVNAEDHYSPDLWIAPDGTVPPLPPGPVDPPPLPADVLARLVALESRCASLEADHARLESRMATKASSERLEAINDRLDAVDSASVKKPLPPYDGAARVGPFSVKVTSTPRT